MGVGPVDEFAQLLAKLLAATAEWHGGAFGEDVAGHGRQRELRVIEMAHAAELAGVDCGVGGEF